VPFRLIDTAGLRRTDDDLEAVGIRLTRQQLAEADIVLFVIDGSEPITREDEEIYEDVRRRKIILVINKSDLPGCIPTPQLLKRFPARDVASTSALYCRGIERIKDVVLPLVTSGPGPAELPGIVPNLRQKELLQRALEASRLARQALEMGSPPDLVAVDLQETANCLGEIIGIKTRDRILDKIFEQFCIGK